MKKGIEWFAYLSEQEQKEFRENCENFHGYMMISWDCFYNFLLNSFDFIDTPQGDNYWGLISKRDVQ